MSRLKMGWDWDNTNTCRIIVFSRWLGFAGEGSSFEVSICLGEDITPKSPRFKVLKVEVKSHEQAHDYGIKTIRSILAREGIPKTTKLRVPSALEPWQIKANQDFTRNNF